MSNCWKSDARGPHGNARARLTLIPRGASAKTQVVVVAMAAADTARRRVGGEARRAGSGVAKLARKAALVCGAAGYAIGRAVQPWYVRGGREALEPGGDGAQAGEPGESLSLWLWGCSSGFCNGTGRDGVERVGSREQWVGAWGHGGFLDPARAARVTRDWLASRSAVTRLNASLLPTVPFHRSLAT
jgi:hypothetical protein